MEKKPSMSPKHKRFLLLLIGCGLLGSAIFMTLRSFSENILFFYTPSDLAHTYVHREKRIRVGGIVVPGSVHREGPITSFKIADSEASLIINYGDLLPNLFREGQAIVAEGYLERVGFFRAEVVLAKHDETYMPKNITNSLEIPCSAK